MKTRIIGEKALLFGPSLKLSTNLSNLLGPITVKPDGMTGKGLFMDAELIRALSYIMLALMARTRFPYMRL